MNIIPLGSLYTRRASCQALPLGLTFHKPSFAPQDLRPGHLLSSHSLSGSDLCLRFEHLGLKYHQISTKYPPHIHQISTKYPTPNPSAALPRDGEKLAAWFGTLGFFSPCIVFESSSQLTKSYIFQRGRAQPPSSSKLYRGCLLQDGKRPPVEVPDLPRCDTTPVQPEPLPNDAFHSLAVTGPDPNRVADPSILFQNLKVIDPIPQWTIRHVYPFILYSFLIQKSTSRSCSSCLTADQLILGLRHHYQLQIGQ